MFHSKTARQRKVLKKLEVNFAETGDLLVDRIDEGSIAIQAIRQTNAKSLLYRFAECRLDQLAEGRRSVRNELIGGLALVLEKHTGYPGKTRADVVRLDAD